MYSQAQESVKSLIFSPKIKWFVIVGVVLFLLATYTQEVLLLLGGLVLLFMGGVLLYFVGKYVILIGLLVAAIVGFIALIGLILGIFL
ncbi:hypothetical protein ACTHQ4_20245 [Alkalicoccobacillus gibsonii]|uniref:hypothetical protein n=1 Tax=Alkalicoccobacillus gibsonii TaxID=79881 RepID=UPI003F7C2A29